VKEIRPETILDGFDNSSPNQPDVSDDVPLDVDAPESSELESRAIGTGKPKSPGAFSLSTESVYGNLEHTYRVAKAFAAMTGRPDSATEILGRILTGAELGITPSASLRGVHIISQGGRVNVIISAQSMLGLVRRKGWMVSSAEKRNARGEPESVTVTMTSRDGEQTVERTWTMADAQRAGLTGKGPWKQYPGQMLQWRATADAARFAVPDMLSGVYIEDERDDLTGQAAPAVTHGVNIDEMGGDE